MVNLRNFWKNKVIYYKAIVLLFSKWCLCLVFVILELRKIQYFLARIHFSHGSFVMYSNALNLGLISNSPKNETLFDRKLKSYVWKIRNFGPGTDFLSILKSLNFSLRTLVELFQIYFYLNFSLFYSISLLKIFKNLMRWLCGEFKRG